MSKNFLKAIGDIKKQKDRETRKENKEESIHKEIKENSKEEAQDLSSSEEQKLKALGAFKKKIVKEEKEQSKWKHDKFKQAPEQQARPQPTFPQHQLTVKFIDSPGYAKIFSLIKHIKIYVREITDNCVSFNSLEAYSIAIELFRKAEMQFTSS